MKLGTVAFGHEASHPARIIIFPAGIGNILKLESDNRVSDYLDSSLCQPGLFAECSQHAGHAIELSDVTKPASPAPSARKLDWNALNKDRYDG